MREPALNAGVSFESAWASVVEGGQAAGRDPISPDLEPLLRQLYETLEANPVSTAAVKTAIIAVLRYLTTPDGRTDANCYAANLFMLEDWGPEDPELFIGDELNDVLVDMGGALHDTILYPHIAENFFSTPEQLLERAVNVKSPWDDR